MTSLDKVWLMCPILAIAPAQVRARVPQLSRTTPAPSLRLAPRLRRRSTESRCYTLLARSLEPRLSDTTSWHLHNRSARSRVCTRIRIEHDHAPSSRLSRRTPPPSTCFPPRRGRSRRTARGCTRRGWRPAPQPSGTTRARVRSRQPAHARGRRFPARQGPPAPRPSRASDVRARRFSPRRRSRCGSARKDPTPHLQTRRSPPSRGRGSSAGA
eukprot:31355-Pelagococcus_subviridis.AAC.10